MALDDNEKFNMLYRQFEDSIKRSSIILEKKIVKFFDAEDIAQELFLKLYLAIAKYDPKRGCEENYYRTVLMYAKKDIVKKAWAGKYGLNKAKVSYDQLQTDEMLWLREQINLNRSYSVELNVEKNLLREDMIELAEEKGFRQHKELLFLHYLGMKQTEIAEYCGCSQATVSHKVNDYRKQLRIKEEKKGTKL